MFIGYGKAALSILALAIVSAVGLFMGGGFKRTNDRPDLVFVTFVKEQAAVYRQAADKFEKDNNCRVQIQVVDQKALQSRLQSALQVGADVPDMVELMYGTMGGFTRGPIDDVGFIDLSDRIKREGLDQKVVASRFQKWSSRGHTFALPHDLHPIMLIYRRDLVEQLGIDVNKLTTWDEFCRVGREVVTKDLDGDGVPDRYMIDLQPDGNDNLKSFLFQRDIGLFDKDGNVTFDDPRAADVVEWYVHVTQGKDRISFPCGWGQNLSRAMMDGLCLFYICPDWRTMQIKADIPSLSGKLSLIPLPAWELGGRRTSTWGGCGLAITKECKNPELAWKLAMYLYYDADQLGKRFAETNILPPLKAAWDRPEFAEPRPFFSNIALGKAYASLANEVPPETEPAYYNAATQKLNEAFANAVLYYGAHGDTGLHEFTVNELKRCAEQVRKQIDSNAFLKSSNAAVETPTINRTYSK